jgi:uncharacterized DUF497 family protein
MDESFEWDEAKAAENYAKHGVSFETATEVFDDPFGIERLDDREDYGEVRFILIGTSRGRHPRGCLHGKKRSNSHYLGATRHEA